MKILNLAAYVWANGGPSQVIFEHTQQQLLLGHEVDILSFYRENDKFYSLPTGANLIPCKSHWFSKFFPDFSPDIYNYLKKNIHKYDLIIIHGVWNFPGLVPFIIKNKATKLIVLHGTIGWFSLQKGKWKKDIYTWLFQRWAIKKADLIQVYHAKELADLDNYVGFRHTGARMIPNGVDSLKFENLPLKGSFRNKHNISADKKIILFLGRLDAKKGIDLLMPAFYEVLDKNKNAVLVLVGPDYGMLAYIKEFCKEKHIERDVLVAGLLTGEEKLEAFVDANVFTLPSYSEGFSIAVLEAMICKLPVVVSDEVGFPESIIANSAGDVVPLEVSAIAKALLKYCDNDTLATETGNRAFELVKSTYEVKIVAKQLLDAVNDYKKKQK